MIARGSRVLWNGLVAWTSKSLRLHEETGYWVSLKLDSWTRVDIYSAGPSLNERQVLLIGWLSTEP